MQHVVIVDVMHLVALGIRWEVRVDFNDARTAYSATLHRRAGEQTPVETLRDVRRVAVIPASRWCPSQ